MIENNTSLFEFEYENGYIKVIRYRKSLNEPFQEIKFCLTDSDGLPYDYTIFDMEKDNENFNSL